MLRTKVRTAPGFHLYRLPSGGWRYSTPDGRFVRVSGDEAALQEVARVLGQAPEQDVEPGVEPDLLEPAALALLEGLLERGAVRPATTTAATGAGAADQRPDATVLVEGRGPLAEAVARLLGQRATLLRGDAGREAAARAAVLVSCADQLPDRRWSEVDRWCRESGTAWHRVNPEGLRWCLGPLSTPGGPGYRDVRGRILAASPWAEELLGLWRHLDTVEAVPPPVTPGTVAALAGALAADVEAFLTGRPVPGAWHQVVHDPGDGTWTRHPVLPLPVTAPVPAAS